MPLTETHLFRDVTFVVCYVTYIYTYVTSVNIKELILIEFFYFIRRISVQYRSGT